MDFFKKIFSTSSKVSKYCDLHIHTTYSDGLLSPGDVVSLAHKHGLDAIAIVDHDAIGGIEPAIEAAKKLNIEVIPAVELSCIVGETDVHVIGYYIDYRNKKLVQILKEIQKKRIERAKLMVERLKKQGAKVELERVLELAGEGTVGRPHIAQALLEEGYISSYDEAFWRYIGYHCPAYVPKEKLKPQDAIKLIKDFGGIPVLAHPMSYNGHHQIILYLIETGIQGLEVWRCEHTEEDIKYLTELTQKHGLLKTGGTDCHGGRKGKILIGELKLPYEIVKELKDAR
ncbi:MAG: PHP domain-containing protein [candidate division WOR-3 bacterium]|nr:PHP domain-containing protein [candidate division WOR-3 bacterium]MCX7757466.1 PHP domain-containing protein [candidate division WOR-3 bacterium]MDW7988008.1 PHP domain-containing protein [candidate division WOR-3 bacterium]